MRRLWYLICCALIISPLQVVASTLIYNAKSESPALELISKYSETNCDCVIAIGKSGLNEALEKSENSPIFVIEISAATFNEINAAHPGRKLVAIFSEPDPYALIKLGSIIFSKHRLALFYSERTSFVEKYNDEIRLMKTDKSRIRKELSRLSNINAVIAIPDSNIWNRQSFRTAVNSLYRQGKALIGFNQSLAKAGAIAALYTDETTIISQLDKMINDYVISGQLPSSAYPESYKLEINNQIARTLNIPLLRKDEIMKALNKELRHE